MVTGLVMEREGEEVRDRPLVLVMVGVEVGQKEGVEEGVGDWVVYALAVPVPLPLEEPLVLMVEVSEGVPVGEGVEWGGEGVLEEDRLGDAV